MTKLILGLVVSFFATVLLMPIVIKLTKKLAFSQTILKYVEEHKSKQGTPTMGGVVFFAVTFLLIFFFLDYNKDWFICLLTAFSFALLGGMDDFIKIKFKRNLGLRSYQKIIGQFGISLIFALYVFFNVSSKLQIPFFNKFLDCDFLIVPIIVLTCLATTNSVNLTDGLDGLAGGVSAVALAISIAIMMIFAGTSNLVDYKSLAILLSIFLGSILGFLVFNTNKASIFMGDVGSLGIGGMFSSVYCLTGLELSLLFVGVMFVMSSLSVIIQVISFKKFHKRVFKMSPLHHHFQQSGFSEAKISYCYSITTLIVGLILILSFLL